MKKAIENNGEAAASAAIDLSNDVHEGSDKITRIQILGPPDSPPITSRPADKIWPGEMTQQELSHAKEEAELGGFMGYVGRAQDFVRGSLKENNKSIKLFALIAIVVLYHVFLGFAISHNFDKAFNQMTLTVIVWMIVGAFYTLLIAAIITFLVLDTARAHHRLLGLGGMAFFVLFMFLFSRNPTKINWHPVIWGFFLQFCSIQVVVYFGAVVALLYYYGIMQVLIRKMAWIMQVNLRTTATESLNACLHAMATPRAESVSMSPTSRTYSAPVSKLSTSQPTSFDHYQATNFLPRNEL